MTFFKKLIKNEEGATAIEYGLIAALIAVAAITAMGSLGNTLENTFTKVDSSMGAGLAAGGGAAAGGSTGGGATTTP